jgi:hypothetical protein
MHLRNIIAAAIAAFHILDEPRHASRRCLAAIHYYGTEERDDVAS